MLKSWKTKEFRQTCTYLLTIQMVATGWHIYFIMQNKVDSGATSTPKVYGSANNSTDDDEHNNS
jgi:hypothetical protein